MKKLFMSQIMTVSLLVSCVQSSKIEIKNELNNNEFDKLVKIEKLKTAPKSVLKNQVKSFTKIKKSVSKKQSSKVRSKITNLEEASNKTLIKSKKIEDIEKMTSEKALKKSPFRVGEKTRIEVSYLNMTAGYLNLETVNIAKVNGKPSYHFRGTIKSRKLFSFIYSVDDVADTYVDIENMRPSSLTFKVVETKKTKNSKTFFNWKTKKATYWSRKVRKGRKPKEVKKVWNLVPGAQNFVSALFYLRTIDFSKNKNFSFPMADEGKNVILKGKVIKKEQIFTDAGTFDAWLVEPKFHINGSLAPIGQLRMWFKADQSQNLVKIETKLKFGSIVGETVELVRGKDKVL